MMVMWEGGFKSVGCDGKGMWDVGEGVLEC